MMRILIAIAVFTSPLFAQTAVIAGVVSNFDGAVYPPGLVVTLHSDHADYKAVTKTDGTFEAQVVPGRYILALQVPHGFPYRRAPLNVRQGDKIFVRLVPRLEVPVVGINADGSEF